MTVPSLTALPRPAPGAPRGQTLRRGALALGAALALHSALLLIGTPKPARPTAAHPPSLQTRSAAQPPAERQVQVPHEQAATVERRAEQGPPREPPTLARPDTPVPPSPGPAAAAAAAAAADTLAPVEPGPTLPAQAPPRLHWQYQLLQAGREGEALLRWEPDLDGRYQASLERRLEDRVLPGWRSEGRFDGQGLAPERFAQARGGRDRQATNFRREQGLISFSASTQRVPLPAGVQDRLSWMLQLSALLSANPALRQPGVRLELPVAGLRGETLTWQFEVRGSESLVLPVGAVESALRMERAALGPYEARIEVWLDATRHFLPVRLRHSLGEQERWEIHLAKESLDP